MFGRAGSASATPALPDITLSGARLHLRPPRRNDWHEWAMLRSHNAGFLKPWEPQWAEDSLSEDYYERRYRRQCREWRDDLSYPFLIVKNDDARIIGAINLNHVVRGAAQFAALGYWLAQSAQAQGYMTEAGRLIMNHAFTTLRLHRLQAASLPENISSRALLARLGFKEEGFAARYLQIDGLWRDHVLYGLPVEAWEKRDIIA